MEEAFRSMQENLGISGEYPTRRSLPLESGPINDLHSSLNEILQWASTSLSYISLIEQELSCIENHGNNSLPITCDVECCLEKNEPKNNFMQQIFQGTNQKDTFR
jgi:hypothetical protein